jgi:hypothetical protein
LDSGTTCRWAPVTSPPHQARLIAWVLAPTIALAIVAAATAGPGRTVTQRAAPHRTSVTAVTVAPPAARVEAVTLERDQLAALTSRLAELEAENAALADQVRQLGGRSSEGRPTAGNHRPQVAERADHS